ncbi:MAG: APC family permease [Nitrospiraceae bacterium]|jgi:amino acid transporter|nr:APC family permease [Nitrospiraceae bacterium]MDW7655213.1 APC family permease [Nitrospiraceae bacterium]
MLLKRWLVGNPLKTAQAAHQRLSKRLALAVFSSDALSSVAYATEEILLVLVPASLAFAHFSIPISVMIILLLAILTLSYSQIIFEYPGGGGAYTVSKSNLGEWPGLTAAASLMIDYVLTVAVSVAAGIAAITSAVPALFPYRTVLGVVAIVLVLLVNLRGVRESGKVFAVPTYLFIGGMFLMLAAGTYQLLFGQLTPITPQSMATQTTVESVSLFLLLRAFSSGCTALTGVEVISNGVPAFRSPEPKNAAITMITMALVLGTLFLGISTMAYHLGVLPKEDETVVSQVARAIFGEGLLYYLIQISTMSILVLAANSAFAGFPRLASLLARDGYMPHQMELMGDRLVFSNGILILGAFSCLLIILFGGDTHELIPLYAVGVFLSFTLSQAGMVRRWLGKRGPHWRKKIVINGIGAVATAIATVIIASTKFMHGAWLVIALIPILIMMFRGIHAHYQAVSEQITLDRRGSRPPMPQRNIVILPISGVNRAVIRAVDYARSRPGEVRAVFVDVDSEATARLEMQWAQWGCGVNLVVLPSPYRSILNSLLDYVEAILEKEPDTWVTVVIPEILPARWWQNILHNQRALLLKASLLFKDRVILTDVPFHLTR